MTQRKKTKLFHSRDLLKVALAQCGGSGSHLSHRLGYFVVVGIPPSPLAHGFHSNNVTCARTHTASERDAEAIGWALPLGLHVRIPA